MVDRKLLLIPFFLFSITFAFGYIDPGTGSLLVNVILGVSLTLIFSLKGFIYDIIAKIKGNSNGKSINVDFENELVLFNEGKNYWDVFEPVISNLLKQDISFIYLTADNEDPGLDFCMENRIITQYLGPMREAIFYLNKLKAKTMVVTTPQLGILHFKRSEYVSHYCQLLHAPIDIHVYKKFAFDDFDSVLCSSSFQIKNLRYLESVRNTQYKELFETGCTYYDSKILDKIETESNSILFAPTWGDKSFLNSNGIELLDELMKGTNNVIFRPHPQSWISEIELLDKILDKFSNNKRFIVDRAVSNVESISKSKIIICDFSGIIYDFILLENRPVIAVKHTWNNGGYEGSDLVNKQSAEYLLENNGATISEPDYKNILGIIKSLSDKKIILKDLDTHIFNFKNAGAIAAKQITEIHSRSNL